MDLDFSKANQHMEYNEENLHPKESYDKLVKAGVKCSGCNEDLTKDEIVSHRYVGIIKPEEMDCTYCWAKAAYETN